MAGGLGLEPRLTVSETVVLPLDDPPMTVDHNGRIRPLADGPVTDAPAKASAVRSTLGVLRRLARFAQADLLAFHFTCVTGHEARFAQRRLQGFVVFDQSA